MAVARRNIRGEVLTEALTRKQKSAPQQPDEVTPARPKPPAPRVLSKEEQQLQDTRDKIALAQQEIEKAKQDLAELPAKKQEAIARIEASTNPYGKAARKYSVSKRYRKIRDGLRQKISSRQRYIGKLIDYAKNLRKAISRNVSVSKIQQEQSKFEAQERSRKAREQKNVEAFIASQGQEAYDVSSPEAQQRIKTSYLSDVSRSTTPVGVTDVNKLSKQYSTAGEFLPEVQRRVARGETLQYTPPEMELGIVRRTTPLDSPTAPTIANAERLAAERQEQISSAAGTISAGDSYNPFVATEKQRFRGITTALAKDVVKPQITFSPIERWKNTLKEGIKLPVNLQAQYASYNPQYDRAIIASTQSASASPFSSEYWAAQGRLFKGSFLTATTGISGGSRAEQVFFGASVLYPQSRALIAEKGVLKRFSQETIQAGKDVLSASGTGLLFSNPQATGAELAGTALPFGVGYGVSRYGASGRASTDLAYVSEGFKTLATTKAGKRGTRGRKPKTLAQRSKESRGAGLNPNVNFDVKAGEVVIKGRIPFKQAPGLSAKERRIVLRVNPRQLAQPESVARRVSSQPNKIVFTLQERGGQVVAQKQFTTARELSRFTRSQTRAGVGRAPGLRPGEAIVVTPKTSSATKRAVERYAEKPSTPADSGVVLREQKSTPESTTIFGKRTRAVQRQEGFERQSLDRGFFGRLGETLSGRPRQKYQYVELYQEQPAPRGFRPGTREAVLGRARQAAAERRAFLEGQSITPSTSSLPAIKPLFSSSLTPIATIKPGIALTQEQNLSPAVAQTPAVDVRSVQSLGQAQVQLQAQAVDYAQEQETIFATPTRTYVPRVPTPKTPEPRQPRQPEPRKPRAPEPRIPVPKRPKQPPKRLPPGITPPPFLKLPSFDFGGSQRTREFSVFANIKGEFKQIDTGLTRSEAITRGVGLTSSTALASFKIAPTGRFLEKEDEGLSASTKRLFKAFRKPKRSSKLRTNDYTFVEPSRLRINTPGELRDITYKGIRASRRRIRL